MRTTFIEQEKSIAASIFNRIKNNQDESFVALPQYNTINNKINVLFFYDGLTPFYESTNNNNLDTPSQIYNGIPRYFSPNATVSLAAACNISNISNTNYIMPQLPYIGVIIYNQLYNIMINIGSLCSAELYNNALAHNLTTNGFDVNINVPYTINYLGKVKTIPFKTHMHVIDKTSNKIVAIHFVTDKSPIDKKNDHITLSDRFRRNSLDYIIIFINRMYDFNSTNVSLMSNMFDEVMFTVDFNQTLNHNLITDDINSLRHAVYDAACYVAASLGPGWSEQEYHDSLVELLQSRELTIDSQQSIPIIYMDKKIGTMVPDIIVNNSLIVELKVNNNTATNQLNKYMYGYRGMPTMILIFKRAANSNCCIVEFQ
ncbi:MAG: GxxExxY protein [Candidatus Riesia sp.]|nr:GxxExxY protein [Candidatus Riesia sp.]